MIEGHAKEIRSKFEGRDDKAEVQSTSKLSRRLPDDQHHLLLSAIILRSSYKIIEDHDNLNAAKLKFEYISPM